MSKVITKAMSAFWERYEAGMQYELARELTAKEYGVSEEDIDDNFQEDDWASE